jgi:CheY-like chemotaxis protein
VDDNHDAANSLAVLLKLLGHQVRVAYDGQQAFSSVTEQAPEIILLDIGLPGMDGYQVARQLREMLATCNPTLVALTGFGTEEDRRMSLAAGFDQHLVKPVDLTALEQLLTPVRGQS